MLNPYKLIKFSRSKINNLTFAQQKEHDSIWNYIKTFKCEKCQETSDSKLEDPKTNPVDEKTIIFKPVGYIKTIFNEKRSIPRQPGLSESIISRVELCKDAFTSNPEMSLMNLNEFSHIWIFYYFHKNDPNKSYKPKVYPPRLDGKSCGVFATRSPHRPNLLGMSLVKLERVEGTTIYFHGCDMINMTPVIDIKPYIPDYDYPRKLLDISSSPSTPIKISREEPEGEEEQIDDSTITVQNMSLIDENLAEVKVPKWISDPKIFKVIFSENSLQQMNEVNINQKSIEEILEHDPRSVYVREKYHSQIYNFQIDGKNIICRFDDNLHTVTVLQIRNIMDMSDCGE